MIALWTHVAPTLLSSFFASLVEFVEALTVVLAVATTRGWRPALIGSAAGLSVLALLTIAFGSQMGKLPLAYIQVAVGTLVLLFGLRWLRKAVLRAAGVLALHDETAIFAHETGRLTIAEGRRNVFDAAGFATAFKITMVEGIEVVFIVLALGAGSHTLLAPAILGALAALILVIALGVLLRRPLAKLPENSLKLLVGLLLTAFGTFWIGEGLGVEWPDGDFALLVLVAGYLAAAGIAILAARGPLGTPRPRSWEGGR